MQIRRSILVSAFLSLALVVPLFASGSGEQGAAAQKMQGKLTIWSTLTQESRAKQLEQLGKDYEKANPGVSVEITVMPWTGAFDKMVASIMAGNPPDLATVGQGWPQSLAGTGGIATLDDVIQKIGGPSIFLGTSLSVLGSLDGKAYSVPVYVTPHLILYHKSWLQEAGLQPPKTWEEFYAAAKAVTDPAKNRYGFAIPFSDIHGGKPIWGFLLSNGVTILDKDAQGKWQLNVNQPASVETYQYLYKLLKDTAPAGVVSYNTTDINEYVAKGVVWSRYETPELLLNVRDRSPEMLKDIGYIPLPAKKRLGASQGWVGLVAFEKGHLEMSKNFIQYMFQGDRLVDFYLSYPYAMFPAVASLYNNQKYSDGLPAELKPIVPMAPDILKSSAGIAMWNGSNAWSGEIEAKRILPNALSDMLVKGISAQAAVDEVNTQIKALMGP
ncbi:MAG TPA: sugar ABC transporter substrate-binding protein [Spirochaetia bacterium]|nr:sugar ABC transporter substrate-binding protein [Spirochaetia bacterium]